MKIDRFDLAEHVLVVAEIGNNHEGSYDRAEEMVGRAAQAGADVVKFQTFSAAEHFNTIDDVERVARLRRFQLTYDEFERLAKAAQAEGVSFISTPLDLESAQFLNQFVPAFKIASSDNTFGPLIELVASFGKPIILSSGLVGVEELQSAKGLIEACWNRDGIDPGLAVLHCVSSYPVPIAEANLLAIATIRDALSCTVGYSDHTLGIDAALLAVALGARIVEKHFTLDKNMSDFRDHQLSADPAELTELVRKIRDAEELLGDGVKRPMPSEGDARAIRRSIAAGQDLPAGLVIRYDHLAWVRPGHGLPPGDEARVVGRRLNAPRQAGQLILEKHLSET